MSASYGRLQDAALPTAHVARTDFMTSAASLAVTMISLPSGRVSGCTIRRSRRRTASGIELTS